MSKHDDPKSATDPSAPKTPTDSWGMPVNGDLARRAHALALKALVLATVAEARHRALAPQPAQLAMQGLGGLIMAVANEVKPDDAADAATFLGLCETEARKIAERPMPR